MKDLKLVDLLRITDDMSDIIIWEYNAPEDGGPLYEGPIFNVPWSIAEMYLAPGLEKNHFMLAVRRIENGNAALIVSVIDSPLATEGGYSNESF